MMIAGLAALVVGILLTATVKARAGDLAGPPGGILDLFMIFVWGGMALMQAANIILHKQSHELYKVSALTWAGSAAVLFMCGGFVGRLLLRLELRRYRQKREDQPAN